MIAIPTLTVDGFTTNKSVIMIKLFEHFLSSHYSQSNTFYGRIGSLKYILSEHKNPDKLKTEIENILTKMYSAYYEIVNVIVDVEEEDDVLKINIDINCVDDNETYKLNRLLKSIDNKIITYDDEQEKYNE